MPPQKKGKGAVPLASGGGRGIDALPDGVIHHILSFLDAKEAVRTCVLARRWEQLWLSASSLRIGCWSVADVSVFLEHVLILRAGSPVDTFELMFDAFEYSDEQRVHLWVRYALLCKARELKLHSYVPYGGFQHDLRLASQHLRSLEFVGLELNNRTFDFLSCPSLQHLHLAGCFPYVSKISSMSLEHLSFTGCCFDPDDLRFRTLICAPSLVSLKLDDQGCLDGYVNRTNSMPSFKKAFENSSSCVLLKGLSEAEDLSLIAESKTFIFKRDLKQRPTFSKLRTLFLNDYWCVAPNFQERNCILKHSLVLETLTLHVLSKGSKPKFRIKGSWNPSEIAVAISGHLKIVEVT